jgi:hypothetical protein
MMSTFRPRGHIQVKLDANGRKRAFWAFWRDQNDQKRGRRLGPAHARDSGRRTPRGAIVWRAGYGEKPSPDYLTPQEAEDRLEDILAALRAGVEDEQAEQSTGTLRQAAEGWLAERQSEKGLKRSAVAGYEDMFERLYRDHGADTPVSDFADGRLRAYFTASSPIASWARRPPARPRPRARMSAGWRSHAGRHSRPAAPPWRSRPGMRPSASPTRCPAPGSTSAEAPTAWSP